MNKQEKQEEVQRLKSVEGNKAKDILMRLQDKLEELDKREAERLGKIIGRLEAWQR